MKRNIVKTFVYEGLGFPIELHNVEMLKIDDEWHPKINVREVADTAIKTLVEQKTRLTGNQIKFIRSYFSMSLREFANQLVKESHTAVSKWEKFGNSVTNMDINIEIVLRLAVFNKVFEHKHTKGKEAAFYHVYQRVSQLSPSTGVQG